MSKFFYASCFLARPDFVCIKGITRGALICLYAMDTYNRCNLFSRHLCRAFSSVICLLQPLHQKFFSMSFLTIKPPPYTLRSIYKVPKFQLQQTRHVPSLSIVDALSFVSFVVPPTSSICSCDTFDKRHMPSMFMVLKHYFFHLPT